MAVNIGRLNGAAVERVFAEGRRRSAPAVLLIVAPRPESADPHPPSNGPSRTAPGTAPSVAPSVRLSVIVSRKIFRDAVPRNRLRRILRESFRLHADRMGLGAADCILMAREPSRRIKSRQDADAALGKFETGR